MNISNKTLGTLALSLGLISTAGAGLSAAASDTTAQTAPSRPAGMERMHEGFGVGAAHGALEADLLGITQEEFRTRVENGENPRDMLDAAGITREDMDAAREAQMQEHLAAAVANGEITQEEADARSAHREEMQAHRDAVQSAVVNNDYDAWASLTADAPFAENITINEATFAQFVEAHTLMQSGDHEAAKAIMEELGMQPPMHEHAIGMHRGIRQEGARDGE